MMHSLFPFYKYGSEVFMGSKGISTLAVQIVLGDIP